MDIVVQNVNDNSPKFDFAVYNSQIPEMVFENFTVYRMIATDLDAGPGGKLTYEIVSGNTNGQFKIGAYTGIDSEPLLVFPSLFLYACDPETRCAPLFIPTLAMQQLINLGIQCRV